MKAQSNLMQDNIWIREVENGIRHITLRRNFEKKEVKHMEESEIIYEWDETDIYIVDRENILEYVTNNYNVLFEQGLINENKPVEPSIEDRIKALESAVVGVL